MGDLFQRVQDTIKASINNGGKTPPFCSRVTKVTTIGSGVINPEDEVSYVTCDNQLMRVPYMIVMRNYGYIPDCVQGGCSIQSSNGTKGNRYFVEFGTTDCETPPPINLLFTYCFDGSTIISEPKQGFTFQVGKTYSMDFKKGAPGGCLTFTRYISDTSSEAVGTIYNEFISCDLCRQG
jgi:hypothetical protein